jgi:hypothetical protein
LCARIPVTVAKNESIPKTMPIISAVPILFFSSLRAAWVGAGSLGPVEVNVPEDVLSESSVLYMSDVDRSIGIVLVDMLNPGLGEEAGIDSVGKGLVDEPSSATVGMRFVSIINPNTQ